MLTIKQCWFIKGNLHFRINMCHCKFRHLYETRYLSIAARSFLKMLKENLGTIGGKP